MKPVLGSIRITVGLVLLLVASLAMMADEPPPPLKLLFANGSNWTTSVHPAAKAGASEPVTFKLTNCGGDLFGRSFTIAPDGADLVRDLDAFLCGSDDFSLLTAPASADVTTVHAYDDGVNRASFVLDEPLGAVFGDASVRVAGVLASDEVEGAWITVFPDVEWVPVILTLHDARGVADPIVELFTAYPPVTQYRVQSTGLFRATVRLGFHPSYGCWPAECAGFGPLYGFGATGRPSGETTRTFPLRE